jgi:hypothetical protein
MKLMVELGGKKRLYERARGGKIFKRQPLAIGSPQQRQARTRERLPDFARATTSDWVYVLASPATETHRGI